MCQVHKILKKYTVTFQINKNTLKIALCYVPSTQNTEKIHSNFQINKNTLKIALCYVPST